MIEAIESDDGRVIAVQFHPERMRERGLPLFEDLVRRAQVDIRTPSTSRPPDAKQGRPRFFSPSISTVGIAR